MSQAHNYFVDRKFVQEGEFLVVTLSWKKRALDPTKYIVSRNYWNKDKR